MNVVFKKRKYAPRQCKCSKCIAPGATPVVYTPGCGPQIYSKECIGEQRRRKADTDRDWARKKRAQTALPPAAATRQAAHKTHAAVKRCQKCGDCPWRRPESGCLSCMRPFAEEVIGRNQ